MFEGSRVRGAFNLKKTYFTLRVRDFIFTLRVRDLFYTQGQGFFLHSGSRISFTLRVTNFFYTQGQGFFFFFFSTQDQRFF